MKSKSKIALGLLGAILVSILIVLAVAEHKYEFLFASPRVSYETVALPATSIRLVLLPPLAKDLILQRAGNQMPHWAIESALPYEAAILLSPDVNAGRIGVTLFVNDRRLGPLLLSAPAQLNLTRLIPPITWPKPTMDHPGRGILRYDGYTDLPQPVQQSVEQNWGIVGPLTHPGADGGHLAEFTADNRDGSLFALLATMDFNRFPALNIPMPDLEKALHPIGTLHVRADAVGPDSLSIDFDVTCRSDAEDNEVSATDFQLGLVLAQISKSLKDVYHVDFAGTKKRDGLTISGTYTFSNFSRLLPP